MNHSSLTVAIGTDHAGFPLKQPIIELLESMGHSVLDFGCNSSDACDYPDFIRPAAESGRPVLLIAHSMGSVIAWDSLWQMSRHADANVDIDLLLTMGSPLGQRFVQRQKDCH